MIGQHWFRQRLGAIRQQAITWANVDPQIFGHMTSLDHNKLKYSMNFGLTYFGPVTQRTSWSTLVQVIACRLFGHKRLPEPALACCQFKIQEQTWNFKMNKIHLFNTQMHLKIWHSSKCLPFSGFNGLSKAEKQIWIWFVSWLNTIPTDNLISLFDLYICKKNMNIVSYFKFFKDSHALFHNVVLGEILFPTE